MYGAVSAAPLQSHFRRAAVIIPLLYRVTDFRKDSSDGVVAMPR